MTLYIRMSGNIGAGKTTIGREVAAAMNGIFVEEPVAEWDLGSTSTAAFQCYAVVSRAAAAERAIAGVPAVVVLDRWIADDDCFARIAVANGTMTEEAYTNYAALAATVKQASIVPDESTMLRVWLDVDVKTCVGRVGARGRHHETEAHLEQVDKIRPEVDIVVKNESVGEAVAAIIDAAHQFTHLTL